MKLNEKSIEWAINHLQKESDTDLFPKPIEIDIINQEKASIISLLKEIDLDNYQWSPFRRFIIPKGELSYRIVTQLNPLDSVVLSAIIFEYGQLIEDKRVSISQNRVFSYRFSPSSDGTLYSNQNSWSEFWKYSHEKAKNYGCIACLDISDFYNQIYHHTVENMLQNVGFPNQVNKAIMRLIKYLTSTVSRGLPVGPHSSHILAEMSLIPIDDCLALYGIEYCRYADDIIIFAHNDTEARAWTYKIAEILDKEQRLVLQRQKTKLHSQTDFLKYSEQMLKDNPLDIQEEEILDIITKHSNNNPYAKINHKDLTSEEKKVFSKEKVESLIQKYVSSEFPDYPRLRWFFRRLSQIGTGEAVDYCIRNMECLIPAISDVCQYLVTAAQSYEGVWSELGEEAIDLLDTKLFEVNEFFQITLLNLFVCNTKLNHIKTLISKYPKSSENIRRKIILCAYQNNAVPFIRELKEQYSTMQDWNKRGYIISCSILPKEEREHFLRLVKASLGANEYLEKILIDWAIKQ